MFSVKKELNETLSYISQSTYSIDFFRVMTGKISLYYTLINELLIDWYYYINNQQGNKTDDVERFVGTQILSKLRNVKVNSTTLITEECYHDLINLFDSRNLVVHRSLIFILANERDDDVELRKLFVKLYTSYVQTYLRLKEIDRSI